MPGKKKGSAKSQTSKKRGVDFKGKTKAQTCSNVSSSLENCSDFQAEAKDTFSNKIKTESTQEVSENGVAKEPIEAIVENDVEFPKVCFRTRKRKLPDMGQCSDENPAVNDINNDHEVKSPEVFVQKDGKSPSRITLRSSTRASRSFSDSLQSTAGNISSEYLPMSSIQRELSKYKIYINTPGKAEIDEQMKEKWLKELELNKRIKCDRLGCDKYLSSFQGMIYHYKTSCKRKWTCILCQSSFKDLSNEVLLHMENHFKNEELNQNGLENSYPNSISLDPSTLDQTINECIVKSERILPETSFSESVEPVADLQKKLQPFQSYIQSPKPGKKRANKELLIAWKKKLESRKEIKCSEKDCGKSFSSLGGIQYHYEKACQRKWICTICNENFRTYSNKLLQHMKLHFKKEKGGRQTNLKESHSLNGSLDPLNASHVTMNGSISIKCPVSASVKKRVLSIRKKLEAFQDYIQMPQSEKKVAKKNLIEAWKEQLELNKKVKCDMQHCGKCFSSLGGITYHYETACQKKWMCTICNKTFKSYSTKLYQHLRLHFPKETDSTLIHTKNSTENQSENVREHVCKFFSQQTSDLGWAKAFKPKKSSWRSLNSKESEEFLPSVQKSMKISCQMFLSKTNNLNWYSLPIFGSSFNYDSTNHISFFAGSCVTSSAWCPTKYNHETTQYICLATSKAPVNGCSTDVNNESDKKGLLQFWDVGNLTEPRMSRPPVLSFAIAHTHGQVRSMVWCPQGCWDVPSEVKDDSSDFMPRLGILAVACGDAFIRIYSIPHPQALEHSSPNLLIYATDPVLTLRPRNLMPFAKKLECPCISWQKSGNSSIVIAGYSNGFVCAFDISSELGATNRDVYPYLSFPAHSTTIMSIAFTSLSSHLIATGGFCKIVKIWNLENTTYPVHESKHSVTKSISWSVLWPGIFASFDGLETKSTGFLEFANFQRLRRISSFDSACQWTHSVSDWLNTIVVGDIYGTVAASILQKYKHAHFSHSFPIFDTEVVDIGENKSEMTSAKENSCQEVGLQHTHGLKFIDYNLVNIKKKSRPQKLEAKKHTSFHFSDFSLAAVNSVQWNPNFGSHMWLFSVGHSGLVRLIHVPETNPL